MTIRAEKERCVFTWESALKKEAKNQPISMIKPLIRAGPGLLVDR